MKISNIAIGISYDSPDKSKKEGADNITWYLHLSSYSLVTKFAPDWRMVGWFFPPTRFTVDVGINQAIRSLGRQEKVIDQQTEILLPGAGGIIPIAVGTWIGMQ